MSTIYLQSQLKGRSQLFSCAFCIVILLQSQISFSQNVSEQGLPFITNYQAKEYQAHPQNWAIVQDNQGIIYVGNSTCLLEYDGVKWRRINPGLTTRSLCKGKDGRIYFGSYGDFGYLINDSLGQRKEKSLLKFIPDIYRNFNDVWTIAATDEGIYFQSRERLFRFKQKSAAPNEDWEVKVWQSPNKFMYSFYLDDTYFVHQQGVGLLKMVNDSLVLIPGSEFIGKERMQVMMPYKSPDAANQIVNTKQYLVGLFYSGLYVYDGKTFIHFASEADPIFKSATLYKGSQLNDGNYALSTTGKGLVVIDAKGKTLKYINRDVGLQDESVYAVFTDKSGSLWLGLDNGISRIETSSPATHFTTQSGITTAVLSAIRFEGTMYIGTSNGLMRFNSNESKFEKIKDVQTNQVFHLIIEGEKLLVPSDGLYVIKDKKTHLIRASIGGDLQIQSVYILKKTPGILLAGIAGGLTIFSKNQNLQAGKTSDEWHFIGKVESIPEDIWSVVERSDGSVWLGAANNGIFRLSNFVNKNGVPDIGKINVERFGTRQGLSVGAIHVFSVPGKELFVSNKALFHYDERNNKFIPDSSFGPLEFGSDPNEYNMCVDFKGRVWINFGKETTLAIPQPDGKYKIEKTQFLPFADRVTYNIFPEENGIIWFATNDGLIRYDESRKKDYIESFNTVIRRVIAGKEEINAVPDSVNQKKVSLSFKNNTLRFEYAAPWFEKENKTQYQTWLEGFEKDWSGFDNNYYKEYTNLPAGNYHFHVRAKNIYQKLSEEAVYTFSIHPPWYATWWAFLLYALSALAIIYSIIRGRTHQLHEKHRELEKTVSDRTAQLSLRLEELAVINSVQEGLVREKDMQGIYKLVGEKIREIFNAQVLDIVTYDPKTNMIEDRYSFEKGDRTLVGSREPEGFRKHIIDSKQLQVINKDYDAASRKYDNTILIGEKPKSLIMVPMISGGEVTGMIRLQDLEKENVFTDSDASLLTTLANSMSVALESARRFDETTRLLKETEQRTAELSVINSVQEGLAKELDMQGIFNLVGNRVQKLFSAQAVIIATFDTEKGIELFNYIYENGKKVLAEPRPINKLRQMIIDSRQSIYIETEEKARDEYGVTVIGATKMPKSLLFVPLLTGNMIRGYVSLQNIDIENAFGNSDIRLLETLANSMSVALENARLFEETKSLLAETAKGKKNIELLSEIGKKITASLDFETIFYQLYENINLLTDAAIFGVGIYHQEREQLEFNFAIEKGIRYQPYTRETSDKNQFPVWCIENRKPVFINDAPNEYSRYISSYDTSRKLLEDGSFSEPPLSIIYLPLIVKDKVLGIITIQSFNKNAYTEYHLSLLQNLATYTSIALDNARAYRQLNKREQEIARRAAELSTVNTISKTLASQLDADDLVKLVGNEIKNLFKADIVYLALLNQKTKIIEFPYQYGEVMLPLKLGEGLTSKIIQTREPLLISKNVKESTDQMGVARIGKLSSSYLGVPIPVGDEIIGVLSVQSTVNENSFNENDLRLLSTIASSVGVALRNATLFEDVKLAKMEAESASKLAEKANEAKSAFLSTVSHELRTPLTSVLGFAKIIRKRLEEKIFPIVDRTDAKTEKNISQVSENLKVVISEGERLTHLINDVLDLAKIEAGKMEFAQENVSMPEVAERAIAATSSLFDQKALKLIKHIDAGLPEVTGDKDKLIQVMINLISNSVKFTDQGSITCKVYRQKDEIIGSVIDTGIGIAPGDFGAVFEQFKQVGGDTLTDKPKGTGLGLPICKEIVEHLGGRIWLESEVGKGSIFSFALPVIPKSKAAKPLHLNDLVKQLKEQMAQSALNIKGKHSTILVVDDDESIRSLLQQELSEAGYIIQEAANGKEALECIRKNRPDLVILDVMMPEMNGFDVAAILKNDPQTMDIPIIVLSIVQDKARGFRIGVDRYLTKPIDTGQLFAEVGALLEQGKSKKKVMVVDEDSVAIKALTDVLQTKGYQVVESDGKELVEKAISSQPDIIILNSIYSDKQDIVQTLRFEKGLENVLFLIYQ